MLAEIFRSRKVRIGLALVLVGLSVFFLKPVKKEQASILPQMPAAETAEITLPPPLNVQTKSEADEINEAVARKIDSIIRLIDEVTK